MSQGYLDFNTPDFTLKLVRSSQTVAALKPKGANGFDFTPADWLQQRSADHFNHLGDLILRVRKGEAEAWRDYDTSAARKPVIELSASGNVLASADLSPTLPSDSPVKITRTWLMDLSGRLTLEFNIQNITNEPVDIGALGAPMVFDNIITRRSLPEAHETCSFSDPYIGGDAGYLQVTRLNGQGPALVVVPDGATPFEAYSPVDEPMPRSQTFEGILAWMVHTQAYAEKEWLHTTPWNPPTLATLAPGGSRTYGWKLSLNL